MEHFRRRITQILNDEEARASIVGLISGATAEDDFSAANLSEIFFGFGVDNDCGGGDAAEEGDGSDRENDSSTWEVKLRKLEAGLSSWRDEFGEVLRTRVVEAMGMANCTDNCRILRLKVVAVLRDLGYNAAVCETRWEKCAGTTAGSYEFIDVIKEETRYFVDLNFWSEFKIARATRDYEKMLGILPTVFVGVRDELKQILAAMSDGARCSLRACGLHQPPWRKLRFLQNKWLGEYRRITNTPFSDPPSEKQIYGGVKCRTLGFDVAPSSGRRLLIPAATSTL